MTSTKETCLADMRASFDEVMAVLGAMPRERLTEVGVTEEWSVGDVLAHEAGYERYVAAAPFGDLTGKPPTNRDFYGRDDPPTEADDANDDSTNACVVAHARTLPVEQVLAEHRWAQRESQDKASREGISFCSWRSYSCSISTTPSLTTTRCASGSTRARIAFSAPRSPLVSGRSTKRSATSAITSTSSRRSIVFIALRMTRHSSSASSTD